MGAGRFNLIFNICVVLIAVYVIKIDFRNRHAIDYAVLS